MGNAEHPLLSELRALQATISQQQVSFSLPQLTLFTHLHLVIYRKTSLNYLHN